VVDLPQVGLAALNGIHVTEWGLHDRNFDVASRPPELLEELRSRHGDHPVWSCDDHGETEAGYARLFEGLADGVKRKTELLRDLLGREEWDLFACSYGEAHCVGHQFWGNRRIAGSSDDAIFDIYRLIDAGIGRLIDEAGPDATVLVVASHGMGEYLGGPQLLPEVLVRLGMGSGGGVAAQVRSRLPKGVRSAIRRVIPSSARRRLQASAASLPLPLESPSTRAIAVDNNRCGAVRLNLRGREPYGGVEPGAEADAVLEEIRTGLYELEVPATGERLVEKVVTAAEAFGRDYHPDCPDLMVVFRTDLGPLEECRSDRIGTVTEPLYKEHMPRVGDHTAESRLWAIGPGAPRAEHANVLDLAPTILTLLDVPAPQWLDGSSLAEDRATA
jgi:predicted AlkP superfamily phosphohydrolase/phosphomutase